MSRGAITLDKMSGPFSDPDQIFAFFASFESFGFHSVEVIDY